MTRLLKKLPFRKLQMKWRMLFHIGFTIVIFVAILLFYLNNVLHEDSRDKLSKIFNSNDLDLKENLDKHGEQFANADVEEKDPHIFLNEQEAVPVGFNLSLKQVDDRKKEDSWQGEIIQDSVRRDNSDINLLKKDSYVRKDFDQGREVHKASAHSLQPGLQPLHHRIGKNVSLHSHKIHLAVVACGDRAEEVLVLLKSAVVMTTSFPLIFYIFAEKELHTFFTEQLNFWPPEVLIRVEYRVYDITFPVRENEADWKKLFKPCASQRLFLPSLLTDVDSLIYVDTDILFLSPLHMLWSFFLQFNATQLVALAPEHEDPNVGWYNRFARHPYVYPLGVNSGVMLMNLTRLRQSTWLPSMLEYYKEYRLKITWGDQDLINIYFHYHPDELYQYSCAWNFRPDHCMYMSICKPAEEHGAFVLHGCRRVMHNDKQLAFKAVYNAFKSYRFGEDVEFVLLEKLKKNLQETKTTQCGKVPHIFLKQIELFVQVTNSRKNKSLVR